MKENYSFLQAFESREDLVQYGSEALTLFGLQLKYSIEDIHSVAVESITDGPNDKKCDVIYLDREEGIIVLAQSFFTQKVATTAKGNKASDLNTAISWLLLAKDKNLPDIIKPRAMEVRDAIREGVIEKFEVWYIHNCPESEPISEELKQVELSTRLAMDEILKQLDVKHEVKVEAIEIGLNKLERLYKSSKNTILVTDEFDIRTSGGYYESTGEWEVFSCNVSAAWIYDMYKEHADDLYSANVRQYLGSRKTVSNINYNIKNTVKDTPENFLVYNNGITALVNSMDIGNRTTRDKKVIQSINIKGISIVNGAQTTGAIGNSGVKPSDSAKVPVRFIACNSPAVVENIIKYNNSQNTIYASDFRSSDSIQTRLRDEFKNYEDVTYLGGRRGGYSDAIPRYRNLLAADRVGQVLMAFHGEPANATHKKKDIWERNELYSKVFNDSISASHIMFVFSLYKALMSYKTNLLEKYNSKNLIGKEETILKHLSHSGSIYMIISLISASLEIMIGEKIVNRFDLKFKGEEKSLQKYEEYWTNVLKACIHFTTTATKEVLEGNLKKVNVVRERTEDFLNYIAATREVNEKIYNEFTEKVNTNKFMVNFN
ncbi:AIPR family protein [Bacillus velezensis]|uniref:AIPR family protein n=1 Tax=Bacillus TaxID=1386 RepID=UPI00073A80CB|nr:MULTISPECIES: AIPR family protein [Bacillus]ALV01396.1 hypothetical protein AVM03_03015 [Bacillus amyloliquefaciens]MEC1395047.1 AIPR family protein [Bacillus velezensis]UFH24260.1 AIPR family protein [Bacillus velezensis]UUT18986.1 AIPR family protein [Bacillus velezensis]BET17701.1 hypothetical protein RBIBE_16910 [Bacillus velezensis]